jgi:hypothetical protein
VLAEFPTHTFTNGVSYSASIWMSNKERDALNLWFRFMVLEKDVKTGEYIETFCLPEQSETIFGDWSLIELNFQVKDFSNEVAIISIGKENSKARLIADELLVREANCAVYKFDTFKGEKVLRYNNHVISLN